MSTSNLNKTVADYFKLAAEECARDRQFRPTSEADLIIWIDKNMQTISKRAQALQQSDFNAIVRHRKSVSPLLALQFTLNPA